MSLDVTVPDTFRFRRGQTGPKGVNDPLDWKSLENLDEPVVAKIRDVIRSLLCRVVEDVFYLFLVCTSFS